MDNEIIELIKERESIAKWMTTARAREMELRKMIGMALFPAAKVGVNTLKSELGVFKYTRKQNFKLHKEQLALAEQSLGTDVYGRLIRHKPELVAKEFKLLTEDQKVLLAPALEVSDGSPTLDIKLTEGDEHGA